MRTPSASIVLPVHNASSHIGSAIDSILNQTYQDFELILIDDGSTDQSLFVMEKYQKCDRRIRIYSRENKGLIYSLNEGIASARGDWVVRMDADDICMPNRLSLQLNWLKETNSEVCGGWVKTFGKTISKTRSYFIGQEAIRLQLLFNSCFAHPTVVARRTIIENFPYSETAEYAEDYDLWVRLAAADIAMTNYPGVVLKYRVHAGQITYKKIREQASARKKIADWYRESCFSSSPNELILQSIMSRWESLTHEQIADVLSFFHEFKRSTGDPEGVVTENAFIFLARHSSIGINMMRQFCSDLSFGSRHRNILLMLSTLKADQFSLIYKILYRVK